MNRIEIHIKHVKSIVLWLVLFFGTYPMIAQEDITAELTEQQRVLVQQQKDLIKANREAFKQSLTQEQLEILENKELTKQERKEALKFSFTEKQKNLIQENNANLQAIKKQFRNTLTDKQRQQIRTKFRSSKRRDNNELRESIKERRRKQ